MYHRKHLCPHYVFRECLVNLQNRPLPMQHGDPQIEGGRVARRQIKWVIAVSFQNTVFQIPGYLDADIPGYLVTKHSHMLYFVADAYHFILSSESSLSCIRS